MKGNGNIYGLVLFVGPFEFTNLNSVQPTSTHFN